MPAAKPAALKLITGRGNGKDAAGRPIKTPPGFKRIPPEKPANLGPEGSLLWDRVVEELPRLELLKEMDGTALAMACHTVDRWASAVRMRLRKGMTVQTSQGRGIAPWVKIEEQAAREYRTWCNEFGLTPAGEMKLATLGKDDDGGGEDPFG